eukprot:gene10802-19492_t
MKTPVSITFPTAISIDSVMDVHSDVPQEFIPEDIMEVSPRDA